MRGFFKIFFATLLALLIFTVLGFFILVGIASSLASKDKPDIPDKSVLVVDLAQTFPDRRAENPFAQLAGQAEAPSLYDVVRLIRHAKDDGHIRGILIRANGNGNSFASSEELRAALIDFKSSRKFVIAHADLMDQSSYFVASVADKVYLNPAGDFDWRGMAIELPFIKDMLDKLEIRPQIFYAGKFKSATEIFRTTAMTPENRLQTIEWLGDIYRHLLAQTAKSRGLDSTRLRLLADSAAIREPQDAVNNKLVDALRYDDQVKDEIKNTLKLGRTDKLSLVAISTYGEAISVVKTGSGRVAVVYAQGDIVDGEGSAEQIGGDKYVRLLRKVRMDNSVKAIVLRVNSGGGSALASEKIWRELHQAREEGKPVVVSFGDVAASGGYYIGCGADSIFAQPNTITGSIGVFIVIPEMSGFFKNKLGVTFDGVKTGPYADLGGIYRPMTEPEKRIAQQGVDRTYALFKQRVAEGRKKPVAFIDSIAQGRVWSGEDGLRLGLVDRLGSLQQAIESAARLAKLGDYGIKEYPEKQGFLSNLFGKSKTEPQVLIREQLGEEQYRVYQQLLKIRQLTGSAQARLPFDFITR